MDDVQSGVRKKFDHQGDSFRRWYPGYFYCPDIFGSFFWANNTGQYTDIYTPSVRILFDDGDSE
ncbi:cbb3-type cytochrome oxidase assembly protein [Sphingobacterium suaedae]|uniref:Cbb3-type cytochrome oxidase assembly protein n=1 Tax=Sphingobacterium suaedae TaxID=1686402 RepID=A0ABW5KLV6_9SPHI